MTSLFEVRKHFADAITNPDGTFQDIRLNLEIFSTLLQQPNADPNLILNGSDDEKKVLMRRIASVMSIHDQIRWSYNTSRANIGYIRCSRHGDPAPEKSKPSKHCTKSFSCNCKASLTHFIMLMVV